MLKAKDGVWCNYCKRKGQIVIPVDARRDLDIKAGDKLLILKRKDEAGLTLIKLDKMDELMFMIQEDEEFFKIKIER